MENILSLEGNLGRKISKNRRNYYPASTYEIAPPRSIDGNPTFDLEQCRIVRTILGTCHSDSYHFIIYICGIIMVLTRVHRWLEWLVP
jgi:hypothetical protein